MKRAIALLLALCLSIGLTACGSAPSSQNSGVAPEEESTPGVSPFLPSGPAPEINLITGEALTEGVAVGDRPVAIMVDNAQAALPQRGVGSADAVLEMVTEGGITRLLALFADRDAVPQTGPVRSARDQHLQFAVPMNALIIHIGTSIYAENLLTQYHYATVNGQHLGSTAFWFDEGRNKTAGYLQEHCWFTDAGLIAAGIEKSALPVTGSSQPLFEFAAPDAAPVLPAQGDAPDVSFSFSELCPVSLTYDAASGKYLKNAYGAPHIDELTGAQLAFDNVLILFTEIKRKNPDNPDNLVMDFALGSGTGYYCRGGKFRTVHWKKGNPEDPLRLTDETGAALPMNTGRSYLAVVGNEWMGTLLFGGVGPAAGTAAPEGGAAPAGDAVPEGDAGSTPEL